MKITNFTAQVKNPERVNLFIDGHYRLSLTLAQVADLGLKVGQEVDQARLELLQTESSFGKLYGLTLNYCLLRPRSIKEARDYLWRKSQPKLLKSGEKTIGLPTELADRVLAKLIERGYLDDQQFADWWVANRFIKKGVSRRKLEQELFVKGVNADIVKQSLATTERSDESEIQKVIAKRVGRYDDPIKLKRYLASRGFAYDLINQFVDQYYML